MATQEDVEREIEVWESKHSKCVSCNQEFETVKMQPIEKKQEEPLVILYLCRDCARNKLSLL